jgi:uracil-DNA glycosylase
MKIRQSWFNLLKDEFDKPYFKNLQEFLKEERSKYTIYPADENVFNAINFVSLEKVKVVIIGQDPYHEPNQAHGLSFSVLEPTPPPPSLVNIYQEIENEFGQKCNPSGDLSRWANQGVLLLNTTLTVRRGQANSHKGKGWENVTEKIISLVSSKAEPVVFLLWGSNAISFAPKIAKHHLVLTAPHPSPLSAYRGFFGCGHFKKCNDFLIKNGKEPIDWK